MAIFALLALTAFVKLPFGSLMWPFLALMLAYFGWLSIRVMLAFLPIVAFFVWLISILENAINFETWKWAAPLFAVCWLILLFGHKIEGRVPSVFQNPNLIFVGPAWLMRRIFRQYGLSDP